MTRTVSASKFTARCALARTCTICSQSASCPSQRRCCRRRTGTLSCVRLAGETCAPLTVRLRSYRLKWDSYAKDIRVVETLHPTDARVHQDLTYCATCVIEECVRNYLTDYVGWCKAPWPLSDRDYVFYRHRTTRDNMHVLISKGIEGSSVPEVSGNVRVEQLRSFMAIRPHPEKDVSARTLV